MITNIDENMGRLMTKLDDWGLAENTLLVFLSDNGTSGGVQVYNADHPEVVSEMLKAYGKWWDEVRPMMINEDASLDTANRSSSDSIDKRRVKEFHSGSSRRRTSEIARLPGGEVPTFPLPAVLSGVPRVARLP